MGADEPVHGSDVGPAVALRRHECSRYRAAAAHALRVHPGPLGELVARELLAYAEFGYRFTDDALIPRLAAHVLATPTSPPARQARTRGLGIHAVAARPDAA